MIKDHSDHSASKEAVVAFHYVKNSGHFGWKSNKLKQG